MTCFAFDYSLGITHLRTFYYHERVNGFFIPILGKILSEMR